MSFFRPDDLNQVTLGREQNSLSCCHDWRHFQKSERHPDLSISSSIQPSTHPSSHLSTYLFIHPSHPHPFIHPPIHPSTNAHSFPSLSSCLPCLTEMHCHPLSLHSSRGMPFSLLHFVKTHRSLKSRFSSFGRCFLVLHCKPTVSASMLILMVFMFCTPFYYVINPSLQHLFTPVLHCSCLL